jgi:hypothetical protein
MRGRAALALLVALGAAAGAGCANTTVFHTEPRGARVYVNGEPCGDSPCTYHSRYGFPNRVRVQILHPGHRPAEFFLDTEPPLASYLLFGFGAYFFHTFDEEYRFKLQPASGPPPAPLPAPPPAPPP